MLHKTSEDEIPETGRQKKTSKLHEKRASCCLAIEKEIQRGASAGVPVAVSQVIQQAH